MTLTVDAATRRVAAGAAFLDGQVPNWRQYIDPNTLDLTNNYNCILAQLQKHGALAKIESRRAQRYEELYHSSFARSHATTPFWKAIHTLQLSHYTPDIQVTVCLGFVVSCDSYTCGTTYGPLCDQCRSDYDMLHDLWCEQVAQNVCVTDQADVPAATEVLDQIERGELTPTGRKPVATFTASHAYSGFRQQSMMNHLVGQQVTLIANGISTSGVVTSAS